MRVTIFVKEISKLKMRLSHKYTGQPLNKLTTQQNYSYINIQTII